MNDVAPVEQAEMICMAKEGFPTERAQSVRRARSDDVVVIGEQHLLRIMSAYVARRSGRCSSPTGSSATVKPAVVAVAGDGWPSASVLTRGVMTAPVLLPHKTPKHRLTGRSHAASAENVELRAVEHLPQEIRGFPVMAVPHEKNDYRVRRTARGASEPMISAE